MQQPSKPRLQSKQAIVLLSRLLLSPLNRLTPPSPMAAAGDAGLRDLSREDFDSLVALAGSNHVVMRGLGAFLNIMRDAGDDLRAAWAVEAMESESARIQHAIPVLHAICEAFEAEGQDVVVIKSLDHWPDFGSDLDLYTNADPEHVCRLMKSRFMAEIAPRSWGDRLARKWNFLIPGLPEPVEVHAGCLGQTGEQVAIASWLVGRSRLLSIGGFPFRVPAASDRLMISALQRLYRHFYFRLCDIVDFAALSDSGAINYEDLERSAKTAGIWQGMATYLVIVSDYLKQYGGSSIDLPPEVFEATRCRGADIRIGGEFLRVPLMPQSAGLYGSQLAGLLRRRELYSTARLGLLPWLAAAAAVGQKLTGSDKGIW
jgi:hypothetical protein